MNIKLVRVVYVEDSDGDREIVTVLEDTSLETLSKAAHQIKEHNLSVNKAIGSKLVPIYPVSNFYTTYYELETGEKLG